MAIKRMELLIMKFIYILSAAERDRRGSRLESKGWESFAAPPLFLLLLFSKLLAVWREKRLANGLQ